MTAVVFNDPDIQARFDRDGYVVFDFIGPEQAALIAEKFYQMHQVIPGGFYSTASNPEDSFKQSISNHAGQLISPAMDKTFHDFKKLGITFLCKAPGEEGKVPVHRDWMVVDESKYFSGTIWVPLSDVTEANGALRVLPGSHKFFNDLRSSSLQAAYKGYEDEIWDQMITVPMKAGQAFLLNHAVIHASSANVTDKERLILVCGIIPAAAKLSYYHGTDKGTVEKFDMPDDMFMQHSDIGGRPTVGTKVSEFDYKVKYENRLKIQQLITASKAVRNIKPLFSNTEMQKRFDKKGYLKLPALNTTEVNNLLHHFKEGKTGSLPVTVTEKILTHLYSEGIFAPESAKVIDARLEVKTNTSEPDTIHQELSYVDETKYCAVTCWLPLTDVSINNGTLGFIDGSHLFVGNTRPLLQPRVSYKFKGSQLDIFPYLQTVDLKEGEAIIFDNRIFHCSLPNNTPGAVLAINIKLADARAQLYYTAENNAKNDAALQYNYPVFTTTEVIELIKEEGGNINKPLADWLANAEDYKKHILNKERPIESKQDTDEREFWNKYTPLNIVREIKKRVSGK